MRKGIFVAFFACSLVLAGCGLTVVTVDKDNASANVSVNVNKEAQKDETDTNEEETKPDNETAEEISEGIIENPLTGLEVEYPGYDENDAAVISLINRFLEESGKEAADIVMVNAYDFSGAGDVEAFIFTGKHSEEEYAPYIVQRCDVK